MNSEELKKLREEFENLKSTPSILDIDESTLNEFRIKGDGNVFKRFYDAIRRDQITPTNEKINKEKENKEINNKEKQNKEIEKEIKNNEKSNIKINNNNNNKEINNKEINNNNNNKEKINKEKENVVKDK